MDVFTNMFGLNEYFITRADTCSVSGKIFFTQVVHGALLDGFSMNPKILQELSQKQAFFFLSPENIEPIIIRTPLEIVPEWSISGWSPILVEWTLPRNGEIFTWIIDKNGVLLKYWERVLDTYAHIPKCDFQTQLDRYKDISIQGQYTQYVASSTLSNIQKTRLIQFRSLLDNVSYRDVQKAKNTFQSFAIPYHTPSTHYIKFEIMNILDKKLSNWYVPQDMKNIDRLYNIKTHTPHLSKEENEFLQIMLHYFHTLPEQYRDVIADTVPLIINVHNPNQNQIDLINALAIASIKQRHDNIISSQLSLRPSDALIWKIPFSHPNLPLVIKELQRLLQHYNITIEYPELTQEQSILPNVLPSLSVWFGSGMIFMLILVLLYVQVIKIWLSRMYMCQWGQQ